MVIRVQAVVITLLLAVIGYGVFAHKSRVESLQDQVHHLEVKAAEVEAECESRRASPNAAAAGEERRIPPSARGPLTAMASRLPISPGKTREEALVEMQRTLAMDSSQVKETVRVLHEFQADRSRIVAEASKGRGLPFSAETLQAVDQARQGALEKLKTVLTEEQHRAMAEKGYDVRLGLRVASQ